MKVYVQWAKLSPDPDWILIDLDKQSVLNRIEKKLEPVGNQTPDNAPGWINAINCQGMIFVGYDHYAFDIVSASDITITCWNDDPEDFGTDRWGVVHNFKDPAPDDRIDGRTNTVQTATYYSNIPGFPIPHRPWSEFVLPSANHTFHGIWLTDSLMKEHQNAQSEHGWKEWVK